MDRRISKSNRNSLSATYPNVAELRRKIKRKESEIGSSSQDVVHHQEKSNSEGSKEMNAPQIENSSFENVLPPPDISSDSLKRSVLKSPIDENSSDRSKKSISFFDEKRSDFKELMASRESKTSSPNVVSPSMSPNTLSSPSVTEQPQSLSSKETPSISQETESSQKTNSTSDQGSSYSSDTFDTVKVGNRKYVVREYFECFQYDDNDPEDVLTFNTFRNNPNLSNGRPIDPSAMEKLENQINDISTSREPLKQNLKKYPPHFFPRYPNIPSTSRAFHPTHDMSIKGNVEGKFVVQNEKSQIINEDRKGSKRKKKLKDKSIASRRPTGNKKRQKQKVTKKGRK